MTQNGERGWETLRREVDAHATALEDLEIEVVGLKMMFQDSLQWMMQVVYGFHDQAVEHAMRFFPIALIPMEGLNPFKASLMGTLEGVSGTSASGTNA